MLRGFKTKRIHDILCEDYPDLPKVTYGTLRNDIVDINNDHRERLEQATKLMAEEKLLARLTDLYNKAYAQEDYNLCLKISKDMAGLSGVTLTINDRKVTLTIETARKYMQEFAVITFEEVQDEDTRQRIMGRVELLDQQYG